MTGFVYIKFLVKDINKLNGIYCNLYINKYLLLYYESSKSKKDDF